MQLSFMDCSDGNFDSPEILLSIWLLGKHSALSNVESLHIIFCRPLFHHNNAENNGLMCSVLMP